MPAQIFRTSDSDGLETEDFCDGVTHYSRTRDSFSKDKQVQKDGPCDGSCKSDARTHDLRADVAKAQMASCEEEDGRILPSVVILDEVVTALLATDQPIRAVSFASMYAKRNSRSDDYCLGSLHLHWEESFDWHRCRDPETFATHTLTASPCDGSCRATTKLTRNEKRSLRKQERDRKAWEAEWNAKHGATV